MPLPEGENYKDCLLEYSSVWSRFVDFEEGWRTVRSGFGERS